MSLINTFKSNAVISNDERNCNDADTNSIDLPETAKVDSIDDPAPPIIELNDCTDSSDGSDCVCKENCTCEFESSDDNPDTSNPDKRQLVANSKDGGSSSIKASTSLCMKKSKSDVLEVSIDSGSGSEIEDITPEEVKSRPFRLYQRKESKRVEECYIPFISENLENIGKAVEKNLILNEQSSSTLKLKNSPNDKDCVVSSVNNINSSTMPKRNEKSLPHKDTIAFDSDEEEYQNVRRYDVTHASEVSHKQYSSPHKSNQKFNPHHIKNSSVSIEPCLLPPNVDLSKPPPPIYSNHSICDSSSSDFQPYSSHINTIQPNFDSIEIGSLNYGSINHHNRSSLNDLSLRTRSPNLIAVDIPRNVCNQQTNKSTSQKSYARSSTSYNETLHKNFNHSSNQSRFVPSHGSLESSHLNTCRSESNFNNTEKITSSHLRVEKLLPVCKPGSEIHSDISPTHSSRLSFQHSASDENKHLAKNSERFRTLYRNKSPPSFSLTNKTPTFEKGIKLSNNESTSHLSASNLEISINQGKSHSESSIGKKIISPTSILVKSRSTTVMNLNENKTHATEFCNVESSGIHHQSHTGKSFLQMTTMKLDQKDSTGSNKISNEMNSLHKHNKNNTHRCPTSLANSSTSSIIEHLKNSKQNINVSCVNEKSYNLRKNSEKNLINKSGKNSDNYFRCPKDELEFSSLISDKNLNFAQTDHKSGISLSLIESVNERSLDKSLVRKDEPHKSYSNRRRSSDNSDFSNILSSPPDVQKEVVLNSTKGKFETNMKQSENLAYAVNKKKKFTESSESYSQSTMKQSYMSKPEIEPSPISSNAATGISASSIKMDNNIVKVDRDVCFDNELKRTCSTKISKKLVINAKTENSRKKDEFNENETLSVSGKQGFNNEDLSLPKQNNKHELKNIIDSRDICESQSVEKNCTNNIIENDNENLSKMLIGLECQSKIDECCYSNSNKELFELPIASDSSTLSVEMGDFNAKSDSLINAEFVCSSDSLKVTSEPTFLDSNDVLNEITKLEDSKKMASCKDAVSVDGLLEKCLDDQSDDCDLLLSEGENFYINELNVDDAANAILDELEVIGDDLLSQPNFVINPRQQVMVEGSHSTTIDDLLRFYDGENSTLGTDSDGETIHFPTAPKIDSDSSYCKNIPIQHNKTIVALQDEDNSNDRKKFNQFDGLPQDNIENKENKIDSVEEKEKSLINPDLSDIHVNTCSYKLDKASISQNKSKNQNITDKENDKKIDKTLETVEKLQCKLTIKQESFQNTSCLTRPERYLNQSSHKAKSNIFNDSNVEDIFTHSEKSTCKPTILTNNLRQTFVSSPTPIELNLLVGNGQQDLEKPSSIDKSNNILPVPAANLKMLTPEEAFLRNEQMLLEKEKVLLELQLKLQLLKERLTAKKSQPHIYPSKISKQSKIRENKDHKTKDFFHENVDINIAGQSASGTEIKKMEDVPLELDDVGTCTAITIGGTTTKPCYSWPPSGSFLAGIEM